MPALDATGAGSLRILVVDDNRDSADSLAMLLRAWGYQAGVAYDGVDALAAIDAGRPHVLLLDIGMPRLDGYALAQQLRRRDGVQPLLVAITGYADAEHRSLSEKAGFDRHLAKPVDLGELQTLLSAEACRRSPPERGIGAPEPIAAGVGETPTAA